ncbi:MAG TPA: MFS transporter [Candidatus Limnocylindria bacterium]|nr:MFS transporter [Candidatus Limnocylindria bacterium]
MSGGASEAVSRSRLILLALFLAGLALRPQLLGIGPLLPLIQQDLGVSHAIVGLLVTIPVFCMAASPLLAPIVSEWLGLRSAVLFSLILLAVAGLLRALLPDVLEILLTSIVVGMGLGVAGALLPVAVKEYFSRRPAFGTGIYSSGIQLGASLSGLVAVPLAYLLGGWRGSLVAFSLFIGVIALAWLLLTPHDRQHTTGSLRPPSLPWRRGIVWVIVLLFGLRSIIFQGLNAWLPAIYVEHGWSPAEAGALVAVEIGVAFPATILVSRLADNLGARRAFLVGGSAALLVSTAGIWLLPDLGWIWGLILGTGMGTLFPITLTLPLDISESRAEVAGATALVLGAGYLSSATAPFFMGLLRDAAGTFEPVIIFCVLLGLASLVVSLLMAELKLGQSSRREAAGPA